MAKTFIFHGFGGAWYILVDGFPMFFHFEKIYKHSSLPSHPASHTIPERKDRGVKEASKSRASGNVWGFKHLLGGSSHLVSG